MKAFVHRASASTADAPAARLSFDAKPDTTMTGVGVGRARAARTTSSPSHPAT